VRGNLHERGDSGRRDIELHLGKGGREKRGEAGRTIPPKKTGGGLGTSSCGGLMQREKRRPEERGGEEREGTDGGRTLAGKKECVVGLL